MRIALLGLACLTSIATLTSTATAGHPGLHFDSPVLLTIDKGAGGYEPGIVVDRYGNVLVTAHKQNHTLVVSPDSRATTKVRSQSWLWTSSDGKTFHDLPGLTPVQEQSFQFGDEGDLARDDTGHLYFVDTNVKDDTFSRYKATGPGALTLETARPVGPFAEPLNDRPWIAAHGDGVVMYAGNEGNTNTYPLGRRGDGDAYGPGRYTIYMSYNHGDTFDPLGVTLKDSGWCRPAADHRPASRDFYMLCTNDNGTIYAYASHDDGRNWSRSTVGSYNKKDPWTTYPSVAVAADGSIHALYVDSDTDANGNVTSSHLKVYVSKDHGRHWKGSDVTPTDGQIRYSWLDVAPNGTVGIAYYFRPDKISAWYAYAGTGTHGQAPRTFTQVAPHLPLASRSNPSAFGDFFQIAFGPDSRLNVVVTVENTDLLAEGLNTDIYYIRQS